MQRLAHERPKRCVLPSKLGSRRWRRARRGRCAKRRVALRERGRSVRIGVVGFRRGVAVAQQPASLEKAPDAQHRALEHAADLTRRKVRQRVKDDVCALFLVHAIEKQHVKVWIES